MCAKSVSEGLLTARFYTNGWPLFTTAICQILSPKLSDVRTETQILVHVLSSGKCMTGSSSKCVGCTLQEKCQLDQLSILLPLTLVGTVQSVISSSLSDWDGNFSQLVKEILHDIQQWIVQCLQLSIVDGGQLKLLQIHFIAQQFGLWYMVIFIILMKIYMWLEE